MDAQLASVSNIESFFFDLLTASSVSKNIYAGELPHNVKDEWEDAVVIDLAGYTNDRGASCETSVLVLLYAKPLGDGSKNVPQLDAMETALYSAIAGCTDEHYFVRMGSQYADYDSSRDLHCNIYSIELLIA